MTATVTFSKKLSTIDYTAEGETLTFPSMRSVAHWVNGVNKNDSIEVTSITVGKDETPVRKVMLDGAMILDLDGEGYFV